MASRHKHRPTLSTIPIPPPDGSKIHIQTPRTAVPKAAAVPTLARSASSAPKPQEEDVNHTDPDDLFVRFTVSEIRAIQAKLRADADAKQEELRLMVGERYRDLLQASTSIISIADSSRRVMGALTEMREAVAPDEPQKKPRSGSIRGKDDAHLKTLQSLSAHLKLLLDAPEHLWRLLEKKEHLHAAWLFLLARVVHRALVTDDPEEGSWENEGISVLAQFPLVQRQWDTVAQFRPQIAHRATQHLREQSISSMSACSTILTLHLLDSLPLTETLSTLLSQRSRTLNGLFARNLDFRSPSRPGSPIFKSRRKNREVAGMLLSPPSATMPQRTRSRKDVIQDVREAVVELLDVIGGTLCIARDIFQSTGNEESQKSLVERSLGDIQSDTPPESVLTTSSLLSTLPSSTHLLTLPPSILSYKPYIDLTSPSAQVDTSILDSKLSAWFDKAMQGFEGRVHAWFQGLESIREVWGVRHKVLEKLQACKGLEQHERVKVRKVLDEGVRDRVGEVANAALEDVEERLDGALRRAVQDVRDGAEESQLDITPSTFLFSAPPIPSLSQLSNSEGPAGSSFKRFKDALRQRADGRTPLLDRVLNNVEAKAREIKEDLDVMNDDYESRGLQNHIMNMYHPAARLSSTKVVRILEQLMLPEMTRVEGDTDQSINVVIFLGRISYDLSRSTFIQSLHCRDEALTAFREALIGLHERSLERWSVHAVSKAVAEYASALVFRKDTFADAEFTWPSQPSPQLTTSLLSLASSLQRLGLSRAALKSTQVMDRTFQNFQVSVAREVTVEGHIWQREQTQLLWDMTFLRRLSRPRGPDDSVEPKGPLAAKISSLQLQLQSTIPEATLQQVNAHIDRTIDHYIPRSQTLFAPLLMSISLSRKAFTNGDAAEHVHIPPIKPTALLPFGPPEADQDFRPAMETVKPSVRFGLLLVGSTAMH